MTAYELKPWPRVVTPHDDILKGDFDLSSYAANLGQVDTNAETCPKVYRDSVAFFAATYRTTALDELLAGVANVVGGGAGNRVIQLRTPFGGGKTHTLIALLHLFRSRAALDAAKLTAGIPAVGAARVAVLPCFDLNAASGRTVDGLKIRTLWGELAYRVGGRQAYEVVRESDEARTNPGGEQLRRLLDGKPTLILLDEVLTYVEAALSIQVGDSNLGRQTMLFLQYLTEVVRGLSQGAMVYSLQQSVREALGDETLLEMLDSLVSRIDAKKEPVTGDEVLRVVQRRLFQDLGDVAVREEVAKQHGDLLRQYLAQGADTDSAKRAALDAGEQLRKRILDSYPFHPELLDLMYLRWGSLPTYQRTRGALQFLATVIGALWRRSETATALIGPGDVPLDDAMVRNTFFSQVGERDAMKSVLDSDLLGTTARCKRVDESIAADVPTYRSYQVGTRLTRALALFSFGAKPGEDRGVLRQDLLGAVQMPGLPADVLDVALTGLSETLLYIHGSGRRFRFEKKPNLNKLLDDEARKVDGNEVLERIQKRFTDQLQRADGCVVWPVDSSKITDRKPRFQVAFLGPDHALRTVDELMSLCRDWTDNCGSTKRNYKNAVAFALPAASALETARTAARRAMAAERLLRDKKRHGFDAEDQADLSARETRSETDLTAAARQLYPTILLPVAAPPDAADPIRLERFEIQGYQALSGGLMESVHRVLENWVFEEAMPTKLASAAHLGEGEIGTRGHWISGPELTDQFFGSVQFPKLLGLAGLRSTVAKGVARGTFGYVMGGSVQDGALRLLDASAILFEDETNLEDIDLSEGSFLLSAIWTRQLSASTPATPRPPPPEDGIGDRLPPPPPRPPRPPSQPPPGQRKAVRLRFRANAEQLFKAFSALQVLSDLADEGIDAAIDITARASKPIDQNTYETAVVMSLEEADIEVDES